MQQSVKKQPDIKIIHKHLLSSMDYFHNFCEENNLTYFIISGTLLGAVRHKGFIPWDDDIDVFMPRKDYEKLLSLYKNIEKPYALKCLKNDKNYLHSIAKFVNNDLIVQEKAYIKYQIGVYIDVFPLDATFENSFLRKMQFFFVDINKRLLSIRSGAYNPSKINKFKVLLHKFFTIIPTSVFLGLMYCVEKIGYIGNKKWIANFYGFHKEKETAPKVIFEEKVLYEFEGRNYWGIKNYDYWLSKLYGDYMKLPNEEQRRSHIDDIVMEKNNRMMKNRDDE